MSVASPVQRPVVSVVVPVNDEEDILPELHRRLDDVARALGTCELVLRRRRLERRLRRDRRALGARVETTWSSSSSRATSGWRWPCPPASTAPGRPVALIHADLQDPPELIPEMLQLGARRGADVVFARRIGRDESRVKRIAATAFYRLMERLARVPYQGQAGDFRLMSRRVVDAVRSCPSGAASSAGMVAWVGFDRSPRYRRAGRAQRARRLLPQLFRLAAEALTAFSDVPLASPRSPG